MYLKVVCILGCLVSVALGKPALDYSLVKSTDTPQDVVQKFLPAISEAAARKGGTTTQVLRRMVMSFLPLQRHLVDVKGQEIADFDAAAAHKEANLIERAVTLVLNFMTDMEKLTQKAQTVARSNPESQILEEISKIAGIATEYVKGVDSGRSDAETRSQSINSNLAGILGMMGSLFKQFPTTA